MKSLAHALRKNMVAHCVQTSADSDCADDGAERRQGKCVFTAGFH